MTRLLRDAEHADETACSLEFGTRMAAVRTAATVVVACDDHSGTGSTSSSRAAPRAAAGGGAARARAAAAAAPGPARARARDVDALFRALA